jgi:tetratricopeptide (TPR) repeat protein
VLGDASKPAGTLPPVTEELPVSADKDSPEKQGIKTASLVRKHKSGEFIPAPSLVVLGDASRPDGASSPAKEEKPASAADLPWKQEEPVQPLTRNIAMEVPVALQTASEETLLLKAAPLAVSAAAAAQAVGQDAVARMGEENRAIIVAQGELASMIFSQQQSTSYIAGFIGAEAAGMQLAYNDAKNLSALAPAAGATPGGEAAMPVQTMPVQNIPVANPAEIMDLPPVPRVFDANPYAPQAPELSEQSRAIADKLPPEPKKSQVKKSPVKIEHFQKNPLEDEEVRKHEGIGISISVTRPRPNTSHMLEEAYEALIAGNQEDAITLYKEVLENEPENKLALFGLATTYHRAGQLKLARPLYGKLLAIDPNNEEGLNNFLVLLADESPEAALDEMQKLERTHPDFSPLPAQMAVIYEKMGNYDEAISNMKHAIELSPENIKYRYDMAVILDKSGDWENAAVFYQQLITANDRGDKIPANPEEIQERLTFIRSNRPKLK